MANTRINLNLLICLHYILKEQSVSLAAKKMFVSQSAMSKSLAQLRERLNDPIIIRNKGRIEITATAKAMQHQVEQIVSSAFNFFESTTFYPERSCKKFSLLCDEITMQLFIPALMRQLTISAPSISFDLIPVSSEGISQLTNGNIDIALLFSQENYQRLHTTTLVTDELVAVVNNTHPLADEDLTTENFTDYSFVTLTPEHKQYIRTTQLLSTQFKRKIIARLPSVSMIFELLSQMPYIAVLPKMALQLTEKKERFIQKALPLPQESCVPLKMVWSPSHDNNSANQWLRSWIKKNFSEL